MPALWRNWPLWRCIVAALLAIGGAAQAGAARGATIVVANRTNHTIECTLTRGTSAPLAISIKRQDVLPIAAEGEVRIAFNSGSVSRRFSLEPNAVYYFGAAGSELVLQRIGLRSCLPAADTKTAAAKPATAEATVAAKATLDGPARPPETAILKIPVKILVDDDEPSARHVWEARLTRRIQHVSDILEHHCRARLEVVAVGTWISDNAINNFESSLQEFQRKVDPAPAQLAIGFTSQYQLPEGKFNLGGTKAALQKHILVREWSKHFSEDERAEVLLHELGHYLGASHSPEASSVMRPVLGDRQARSRDFPIGFDPLNTLALNLVCDELRTGKVHALSEMSLGTRILLGDIYSTLSQAMPADTASAEYLQLLQLPAAAAQTVAPRIESPALKSR